MIQDKKGIITEIWCISRKVFFQGKEWKMADKTEFEEAIEKETGESIESLRSMLIDERRNMLEKRFNHPMQFVTMSDFIGRGGVLFKYTISHAEVEKELEEALR